MTSSTIAICLVTAFLLVGALHYPPLWISVLAVPIWLSIVFSAEERRVRAEVMQRVREQLGVAKLEE